MVEEDKSLLIQILQSVARLETEVKEIKSIGEKAASAKELAQEASQSVKSAHHRLDRVDDDLDEVKKTIDELKTSSSSKWERLWERLFIIAASIGLTIAFGHYFHL